MIVRMPDLDSIPEQDRETLDRLANETEYVVSVLWAERPGGGPGEIAQASPATKAFAAAVLVAGKHQADQSRLQD